jgi:hypothetical protein
MSAQTAIRPEQFAAHSRRFPVLPRKYAVLRKNFTVSSYREFARKSLKAPTKISSESISRVDFHEIRAHASGHHRVPAGLAVAEHEGLAEGLGVQLSNLLEEDGICARDVLDPLSVHRRSGKAREIDWVPARNASPISLICLKPPMPGPCPGRGPITRTGRLRSSISAPSGGMTRSRE